MKIKLLFLLVSFSTIYAQPGTLDSSFNSFDIGLVNQGSNGVILTTAIQSDGKILIGGDFTTYNGTSISRIARLNIDGSIDQTFNTGTGANTTVKSILTQGDGKIIIIGDFTAYNNISRNRIARLNSDGTLDQSFNPGTAANMGIFGAVVQSDGKIIIVGNFTSFNGSIKKYIARLNTNGTLDQSFSTGTGFDVLAMTVCLQSDGKITVGGYFSSYNGSPAGGIVRLNSDGTLDNSFNTGTGANSAIGTLTIQNDDKIIIGGDFTSYNGIVVNRIARLNTNGTVDQSFNIGTGANNTVSTSSIQSDGKIIIGGNFTTFNGIVRSGIVLLNSDGSLDSDFNAGVGVDNEVLSQCIQSDGKIIIGGTFTSYNGTAKNRVARINGVVLDTPSFDNNVVFVYPNPTSSILNIRSNITIDGIAVYNLLGQLVLESKNTEKINVQNLDSGHYIMKLTSGNTLQIKKFVKN